MRKWVLWLIVLALVIAVVFAFAADTDEMAVVKKPVPSDLELVPGTYELVWDSELDCSAAVYSSTSQQIVPMIKSLPELVSKQPKMIGFPFDGQYLLAVLDESKGSGEGYDTAYIDTNRDGDLSDEKALKWDTSGGECYQEYTPWTQVRIHCGEHPAATAKVRLLVYSDGLRHFSVRPERTGTWRGKIDSNKGKVEIAVVDGNSNGAYNDNLLVNDGFNITYASYDYLLIDCNLFGRVITDQTSPHYIALCNVISVAGRLYSVEVSRAGDKVTISPYTKPAGRLVTSISEVCGTKACIRNISTISKAGYFDLRDPSAKGVMLPAGQHKVDRCDLEIIRQGAEPLKITGRIDSQLDISPDKDFVLKLGGDVSVAINPELEELILNSGKRKSVDLVIRIGDKVIIQAIDDQRIGSEPKVKFFDDQGKMVHMTTAGYT